MYLFYIVKVYLIWSVNTKFKPLVFKIKTVLINFCTQPIPYLFIVKYLYIQIINVFLLFIVKYFVFVLSLS